MRKAKKGTIQILAYILKPLIIHLEKRNDRKRVKINDYNRKMTDEELMFRFAKHTIRTMIKTGNNRKCFPIFNKKERFDYYEKPGIISYELNNLRNCKDEYLSNWRYIRKEYTIYSESIVENEAKLRAILKEQFEKMGIKVVIENNPYNNNYWAERIGCKEAMVIYIN